MIEEKPNNRVYPVEEFEQLRTPFYCYDMELLRETIEEIIHLTKGYPYVVHYALKANANPKILKAIATQGLCADLVSGGELEAALTTGFDADKMAFSGVGKADWEIRLGLEHGIGCFNVESIPELENINLIAGEMGKTANVAIRVNPDIDAHTHRYVTTGTAHDKFGISKEMLPDVVSMARQLPHVHLRGLHFHIGSQITEMQPFVMLCETINELLSFFEQRDVHFETINVGGGLGIDYSNPDRHQMPNFEQYFNVFKQHLDLREGQELHFELGRSLVAQCGSLIARVLYVKENRDKKFVILDAGMTDLIRPALYEAHHLIQNISSKSAQHDIYDVVGPVCESSDVFARDCQLPETRRGDFIALRSVGAYGESMASTYNMRSLPGCVFLP
ncbi:MAG: diaminopimelate decarboxylase [Muribaculaceae bacterium]|nr:diaminopimelate decarboxylase [Muribaculaceae bacterium]